jgi:thiol-disulfide isomerase/thioredoxin
VQKFIKNSLLIFVFITIGFAVGKHTERAKVSRPLLSQPAEAVDYTSVIYFHGNQRCKTCKMIEAMARRSVSRHFKNELGKTVKWRVMNYQTEKELAKKFDLSFSTVVVTRVENGQVVKFQRLDEVWEKLHDELNFSDYIAAAVQGYLGELK